MKRSNGSSSRRRRPTAQPRPPTPPPPPANMLGDLNLGQCMMPHYGNEPPTMKPHFFSIIVEPSLHLHQLPITPQFRNEHGRSLLDHAFLRAPKGTEYIVELMTGEDGTLWFRHGWEHFADVYSLDYGSFLVFRYEGSSKFNVFVFDTSCVEIDYPSYNMATLDEDEDEDWDEDKEEEEQGEDVVNEAEERARAFRCGNPSFTSVMRPSYVSGDFRLWVPASYAKMHMMRVKKKNRRIVLQLKDDPKGKTWSVDFTCEEPRFGRLTTVRLTTGWSRFAVDNGLEVGNTCIFELIDKQAKIYRVHIPFLVFGLSTELSL